jgi:hypothetical protein
MKTMTGNIVESVKRALDVRPPNGPRVVLDRVYYFHIRAWEKDEFGFEYDDLGPCNKGGVTVAAKVIEINHELNRIVVQYARARCSKKDQFSRKTGRTIAEIRLKSPKAARRFWEGEDLQAFSDYLYRHYSV